MSTYRLIIAGSRGITDYAELIEAYRSSPFFEMLKEYEKVEIVSGTARGADRLGEQFAYDYELQLTRMPAEWNLYGKSAGYRRNEMMADYADGCLVLWDGESRGTRHMIDLAEDRDLDLHVHISR